MKILSTMGQLCTERSPESNNLLVKSQNFDNFLLSSNRSVHNSPIGANIFNGKSTSPILRDLQTSTMNLKLALNLVIKIVLFFIFKELIL
jgi:hypothetical protein